MMIASLIGWILLGVSIALAICMRGESVRVETGGMSEQIPGEKADMDNRSWCEAVAAHSGASVYLLTPSLRLIASSRDVTALPGTHLMDIVPLEAAPEFLNGTSAARRGEGRKWISLWNDREIEATASPVGSAGIMVTIAEISK